MLKFLSETYGDRATLGDKNLLDFLRDETIRLQLLVVNSIEKLLSLQHMYRINMKRKSVSKSNKKVNLIKGLNMKQMKM